MALREEVWPWDRQPNEPASIDATSEVASGLVAGFSTGTGRPIRHFGKGFATAAGATVSASRAGLLLKLSGSSSGLQIPAVPIDGSAAVQVTGIVQITSQNAEMVFEQSATADSNAGFYLYGISASTLRLQVNNGTAFAVFPNSINYTFPATPVVVTVRVDISANPARGEFWADGVLVSAQTVALAAGTFLANTLNIGCRNGTTLSSDGAFGDTFVHSSWTQDSALAEWHRNLWAVYEPRRIWVPVSAGGGGSHDATGAMSAQSAAVSGSAAAVATYTSSGALTAQAATVAGSATHTVTHASSGVLEAQAATVAGSADHAAGGAFSATGALTAQAAAVAGSAVHLTLHTATGALASGSATAAGAAVHYTLHTATGDLVADAASISGSALHEGDGAEVAKPFTGAGRPRRTRPRVVVEIDGEDFIAESPEEAQAILDQAKEAAEEKAKVAIERATKARNRPTRKVMADARKALELPAISAPDLGGYAEEISRQIEDIYQSAIQTIEVAALLRKRELEEEDDEDILLLIA